MTIAFTKLLILNHRVWSPTRWRSTKKWWRWRCHLIPKSVTLQIPNWNKLLLDSISYFISNFQSTINSNIQGFYDPKFNMKITKVD
jgi:hypothetical protein